ncbi:NADP-dependent oxidoreductase [Hoeflea sp. WL0058]|uniref:NADP-dependent oxidoreductase n=2 Tax=Flavimaribacter sediminis TaxID=2865987 RepID=A0AAE3CZU6_9HYPH|nr:NADP-dependent oxidoreductase [Flavimaribacter sediminis]
MMSNDTMKRIVLASRPDGPPTPDNFRLEELPMPAPGPGEILVRTIWLSLDPYMRGRMDAGPSYAAPVEIGATMEGGCVGQVIESNNPDFSVGDFVDHRFGWCTHGVSDGKGLRKLDPEVAPLSANLGVLGMPGMTAYAGLNIHGRPKEGETLVVGAATGAVGTMVGQLAKAQGLRVVGVAGGPEKCAYATETLGFDACLDHRAASTPHDLRVAMGEACPDGVDIYFENVGGKTLEAVLPLMNTFGRIPICGVISWYNAGGLGEGASEGQNHLPRTWRAILVKRLSVRGFIVTDHYDQFPEFLDLVGPMVKDGRIQYRETIAEGLESAPQALISLLEGGNFGKQLVAVSEDPTRK